MKDDFFVYFPELEHLKHKILNTDETEDSSPLHPDYDLFWLTRLCRPGGDTGKIAGAREIKISPRCIPRMTTGSASLVRMP